LASVRVPKCPPERAKLAMSDTIFRDRYTREALGRGDSEPPMVCYAHCQRVTALWLQPSCLRDRHTSTDPKATRHERSNGRRPAYRK
jgi:hypothetical protein